MILRRVLFFLGGTVALVVAAIVVVIGVFAGPTVLSQISGQVQASTLQQGSTARTFRIYTPANLSPHPGAIIVLQGAGGSGGIMEAVTGLDREADRMGWIVVYADAAAVWSHGWDPYTAGAQNPDVAFMSSLIDRLESDNGIDPGKVFVTGWSRGAMMSYRLGCDLSSKIAAIAPVDGSMADMNGDVRGASCHPDQPVSVLGINGSADLNVPIEGGHSHLNEWETISYSAPSDVIDTWRDLDRCGAKPSMSYSGPSTTTSWSCTGGSMVSLRVVSGGDHNWPGALVPFLMLVDFTPPEPLWGIQADTSFDASRVIADFFVTHARTTSAAVASAPN
jgi:polyhydroxybutyrate depolymerase